MFIRTPYIAPSKYGLLLNQFNFLHMTKSLPACNFKIRVGLSVFVELVPKYFQIIQLLIWYWIFFFGRCLQLHSVQNCFNYSPWLKLKPATDNVSNPESNSNAWQYCYSERSCKTGNNTFCFKAGKVRRDKTERRRKRS